uniref:uncharacterized protein LOC120335910 n=1 Tax=Styela clava TaxID=7725 RepID=UPI00193ACFFA|nr:uncharacterized protein LOC120335910 [Styela clava]
MAILESCSSTITIRRVVVVISVSICASSFSICQYFIRSEYMNHLLQQSKSLRFQMECLNGPEPETRHDCWKKYQIKSSVQKQNNLTSECLHDEQIRSFINKNIDRSLESEKKHLENDVGEIGKKKLDKIVERCYGDDKRFVVHWIARDNASVGIEAHTWFPVTELSNDRSIYTVSPGYEDSFVNGAVKIPKNGLYMIYGKITAKCEDSDEKLKRIHFEIRMRIYDNSEKTLLSETRTGVCRIPGDLLTMFQQGLLRLAKGNLIYIRVKFPENVKLSDEDSWFKNNIGVSWVGRS